VRALIGALLAAAALASAPAASAEFGFEEGSLELAFESPAGELITQAGSHPFGVRTSLALNTTINPETGKEVPEGGEARSLEIDFPPGFVATPDAVPACSAAEFLNVSGGLPACPDAAALGVARVTIGFGEPTDLQFPVYNLIAGPGEVAKLGFIAISGIPVTISAGLAQTPPYNARAVLTNIPQSAFFYSSDVTLWGNPASAAHDPQRGRCGIQKVPSSECPVSLPEVPFATTPRSCTGPLITRFAIDSWGDPGAFVDGEAESHDESLPPAPLGMSGCERVGFAPQITSRATSAAAESASGLEFTIEIDDPNITSPSEEAVAGAEIKKAVITLPSGVTANPSLASGLATCTSAQIAAEGLATPPGAGCPQASKIGSVAVESPLLEGEVLEGPVYLAAQGDNPFASLLAFYIVIADPELGILVKLPAKVEPDPATGQLTTTVEDSPQVPISSFRFRFREGPRGPLITPPTCGTHTTVARFYPWSDPADPFTATASFVIAHGPGGGPCPLAAPFAPGFEAGSLNNAASQRSPFEMRLTRADGEQDMTRFSAQLPKGLVPQLAGVPQCSQAAVEAAKARSGRAELAAPSCPAASVIGHLSAGAGVGSVLTWVGGTVYLGGPYGGRPLSAVAITPAVAGPFDVGTVVTQVALDLDPDTYLGLIDGAASDPIPHILQGIPLKLRDLRVRVDRPGFMTNPTSCEPTHSTASIWGGGANPFSSADDAPAPAASRYQAASCAALEFSPRLSLRFRGQTKRTGNPAVRAVLRYPGSGPGYANLGRAAVLLPKSTFIDNSNIPTPCTRVQFAEGACPRESILGRARAFTPLLDDPLEGPVYFRSNGGERELPDIVADLRGQFRVTLVGWVDSRNGRTRTRFVNVPDAPVSRFVLNLYGAKRSLLTNSTDLCRHRQRAKVNLAGQNGAPQKTNPLIKVSCKKKKKASRRHGRRAR
jgi:hypothetical protein